MMSNVRLSQSMSRSSSCMRKSRADAGSVENIATCSALGDASDASPTMSEFDQDLRDLLDLVEDDARRASVVHCFRANTRQMDQWVDRVDQMRLRSDRAFRTKQERYERRLENILHGAPALIVDSPFAALHRRIKADLLGLYVGRGSSDHCGSLRNSWSSGELLSAPHDAAAEDVMSSSSALQTRRDSLMLPSASNSRRLARPASSPAGGRGSLGERRTCVVSHQGGRGAPCVESAVGNAEPEAEVWREQHEREFRRLRAKIRRRGSHPDKSATRWDYVAISELFCESAGLRTSFSSPRVDSVARDDIEPGTVLTPFVRGQLLSGHCEPAFVDAAQIADVEARVAEAVVAEHAAHKDSLVLARRRYLEKIVHEQRLCMERERKKAAKEPSASAVANRRRAVQQEVSRIRSMLSGQEESGDTTAGVRDGGRGSGRGGSDAGRGRGAGGRWRQTSQPKTVPGTALRGRRSAKSATEDTRRAYTGGPRECWHARENPGTRKQVQMAAARKIQRCWRTFQKSWCRYATFELIQMAENKRWRAEAEEKEMRHHARARQVAQRKEFASHPERFADQDDARFVHYARAGDVEHLTLWGKAPFLPKQSLRAGFFAAAAAGALEVLKYLLAETECSPVWQDPTTKKTSLHVAAQANQSEACLLLQSARADMETLDAEGKRAIDVAGPSACAAMHASSMPTSLHETFALLSSLPSRGGVNRGAISK
eukprot:TRINITY_DN34446_c0_g1_i1.p1 TRINITY_DN34446_c0_g1~~TRINITY_DN34446_c0_g1_i1.p1  ORF type:complete len:716 (-),score=107.38 TRINITY_DN34446_c0_g1_i1:274-2421(-)